MSGSDHSGRDDILDIVGRYYSEKILTHGATPRGVDWRDAEGQSRRFAQLLRHFDLTNPFSLIEIGCGYGALALYLRERGLAFAYSGFDIAAEMIHEARTILAHEPRAGFATGTGSGMADFVVASGIFNVRFGFDDERWSDYVLKTCDTMVGMSRRGCAFNLLTGFSDRHRREARLWYPDPGWVLGACLRRYGRRITLSHDYGMYEFTVAIDTTGLR